MEEVGGRVWGAGGWMRWLVRVVGGSCNWFQSFEKVRGGLGSLRLFGKIKK